MKTRRYKVTDIFPNAKCYICDHCDKESGYCNKRHIKRKETSSACRHYVRAGVYKIDKDIVDEEDLWPLI